MGNYFPLDATRTRRVVMVCKEARRRGGGRRRSFICGRRRGCFAWLLLIGTNRCDQGHRRPVEN